MKLLEVIKKYSSNYEFLAALQEAVIKLGTEKSNFIYNPGNKGHCSYNGPAYMVAGGDCDDTVNKEPIGPECKGCIFGQALQNMGWDDVAEMTGPISSILSYRGLNYKKLDALQEVQNNQDKGMCWGESIKPLMRKQV